MGEYGDQMFDDWLRNTEEHYDRFRRKKPLCDTCYGVGVVIPKYPARPYPCSEGCERRAGISRAVLKALEEDGWL